MRCPSFITDRNLISMVQKAGNSQWESKRNGLFRVEKYFPARPLSRWPGQREQFPAYPWLTALVCRERPRGRGRCQGLGPTQGRACGWLVAVRRCPCIIGSCTVGAPGSGISSWEEGARVPENQALRLHLHQTKPQMSTRFAPRFASWLCRLSTWRL